MQLRHVTSTDRLEQIQREGLRPGTYFVHEDWTQVLSYYAETIEDEGLVPVVLAVDAAELEEAALEPDHNGFDEPLTHTLGMSEDEIAQDWEGSGQTWRPSIEIIGTCRYRNAIAPHLLQVLEADGLVPRPR